VRRPQPHWQAERTVTPTQAAAESESPADSVRVAGTRATATLGRPGLGPQVRTLEPRVWGPFTEGLARGPFNLAT
jgi:hypothetical protein